MTLENCKRLLKHYEDTGNFKAADDMRAAIERRVGKVEKPKK